MSRALAELQAMCEAINCMPCRVVRLWPNDLPVHEVHKQGFYWAPLDPCRTRPITKDRIFLGQTLSDAKQTLLKAKLPRESKHA